MGEGQVKCFDLEFNDTIKMQGSDRRISGNTVALLGRGVGPHFGAVPSIAEMIEDPRRRDRIRHTVDELPRERAYSMVLIFGFWTIRADSPMTRLPERLSEIFDEVKSPIKGRPLKTPTAVCQVFWPTIAKGVKRYRQA